MSAHAVDSPVLPNTAFRRWFDEHRRANQFTVHRIPFDELVGWRFEDGTGNLVHDSGKFFSVEGLDVHTDWGDRGAWMQPIINQPEIGILGIVVKEFDGILHCLMQAKMEPGNLDSVQLSPTVQATRSNYTGVHRGRSIRYLEYFLPPRRGDVVIDSLQSEQGAWFLHKRNRNMVVEVTEDLELLPDFCWLTVGQIHELLRVDNLVNMDARTVLSCMPFATPQGACRQPAADEEFQRALAESVGGGHGARHTMAEVLSWLVAAKSRHILTQTHIPLRELEHWRCTADEIAHEDGKYFRVVAVDVHASNREVTDWSQPLVAPVGHGVSAFLVRRINGVLHLLVQARVEAGTLHCLPSNYHGVPAERRPPFLDYVLATDQSRVRYEVLQSEEGGRFYHAQNRYLVVEVEDGFPLDVPEGYRWVTVNQLMHLLRLSNYLNVEARSLVACVNTLW